MWSVRIYKVEADVTDGKNSKKYMFETNQKPQIMRVPFFDALKTWDPEIQLTVKVRFIQRGSNEPLHGSQYIVRLYDKDIFSEDDYIGSAKLNENGEAHIHFYSSDLVAQDILPEDYPDLYVLLFKGDTVHFQSKVWDDVDFDKDATLSLQEGEVLDFGTYLVD